MFRHFSGGNYFMTTDVFCQKPKKPIISKQFFWQYADVAGK
jgi:hypothetical protein